MKNLTDFSKTMETGVDPHLGLFNFFVANYVSPTPPPTSRGCTL